MQCIRANAKESIPAVGYSLAMENGADSHLDILHFMSLRCLTIDRVVLSLEKCAGGVQGNVLHKEALWKCG
jgi:hypothetical protein